MQIQVIITKPLFYSVSLASLILYSCFPVSLLSFLFTDYSFFLKISTSSLPAAFPSIENKFW